MVYANLGTSYLTVMSCVSMLPLFAGTSGSLSRSNHCVYVVMLGNFRDSLVKALVGVFTWVG